MERSSMDDGDDSYWGVSLSAYYCISLQTPLAYTNQPDVMVTQNKLSNGSHSQR
jgi:hypothetical protein